MSVVPLALVWGRTDTAGAEHVVFDDRRGLHARGVQLGAHPVPYAGRYELDTDEEWVSVRLQVTTEGAGFRRTVRLERAAGRWRVTAGEQGDLGRAARAAGHPGVGLPGADDPALLAGTLDIDIAYSPLTNTLPVRRLGLLGAEPGRPQVVDVAWVLMPSLAVIRASHTYTPLRPDRIRFSSGAFTAELSVDLDGYVIDYPGLAKRG